MAPPPLPWGGDFSRAMNPICSSPAIRWRARTGPRANVAAKWRMNRRTAATGDHVINRRRMGIADTIMAGTMMPDRGRCREGGAKSDRGEQCEFYLAGHFVSRGLSLATQSKNQFAAAAKTSLMSRRRRQHLNAVDPVGILRSTFVRLMAARKQLQNTIACILARILTRAFVIVRRNLALGSAAAN